MSHAWPKTLSLMPAPNLMKKGAAMPVPLPPGKQSEVYTTGDAFDKVLAFYKGLYKEFPMRGGPKLPSGQAIQWAFSSSTVERICRLRNTG